MCSNETIHGVEFHELPDLKALAAMRRWSSIFLRTSPRARWNGSRVGLALAARRNTWAAGLTIVVVREDLLGHALPICPARSTTCRREPIHVQHPAHLGHLHGGPDLPVAQAPTRGRAHRRGGHGARNIAKAQLFTTPIDQSPFYVNKVEPAWRSRMNIPFFLRTNRANDAFWPGAKARGLLQLKGHKVRGRHAQPHNAMPIAGVQALVDYMQDFERRKNA